MTINFNNSISGGNIFGKDLTLSGNITANSLVLNQEAQFNTISSNNLFLSGALTSEIYDNYDTYDLIISDINDFTYSSANIVTPGIKIDSYNGSDETVVIPYKINGLPVTEIYGGTGSPGPVTVGAFQNNTTIKNIYIPKSVTRITGSGLSNNEVGAFYGCSALEFVYGPNISIIEQNGFRGCTSLSTFINTKLGAVYDNAFDGCSNLTEISFYSVSSSPIGMLSRSFANCPKLHTINMDLKNNTSFFDDIDVFSGSDNVTIYVSHTGVNPPGGYWSDIINNNMLILGSQIPVYFVNSNLLSNLTVMGSISSPSISANYFYGDGSLLDGVVSTSLVNTVSGTLETNYTTLVRDTSGAVVDIGVTVIETSTDYTFSNTDNNKIIHFDTTSQTLSGILPASLKTDFNCAIMNTGTNSVILSAYDTIKSIGVEISAQYGGAFIYKDSSNNIYAVGRF